MEKYAAIIHPSRMAKMLALPKYSTSISNTKNQYKFS